MTLPLLVLAALCISPAVDGARADKHPAVRLFVFTAHSASGTPSEDEAGRADAVREMRDALRHKSGITLVDERAQADVLAEVVGREQREAPSGGFGGKSLTNLGDVIIRLHVQAGGDQIDLKGVGAGSSSRAAKDAAERLVKWIARHEPAARGR